MKFKKIIIENLKSITYKEIDLAQANILLGENGSGKTSTIIAFTYLLTGKIPDGCVQYGKDHLQVTGVLDDGADTELIRIKYADTIFQINGSDVSEAMFKKGVASKKGSKISPGGRSNSYFRETCLESPDSMWEFLETGHVKRARMSGGKELEAILEDGNVLYRWQSPASVAKINGEIVTLKAYNEYVARLANGNQRSVEISTSSDVIEALQGDGLSEFILETLPMPVDFEKLMDIAEIGEGYRGMLAGFLPSAPEKVSSEHIREAHKLLKESQLITKRKRDELLKRSIYEGPMPVFSADKAELELASINQKIGAASSIEKAWKNYEAQMAERKSILETLKKWQDEYKAMKDIAAPDIATFDELKRKEETLSKRIEEITRLMSAATANNEAVKKLYSNLDVPRCPIYDKIECKTDMSGVRAQLEEVIAKNNLLIEDYNKQFTLAKEQYNIIRKEQESLSEKKAAWERKQDLLKKFNALKATLSKDPPKEPESRPDIQNVLELKKRFERYKKEAIIFHQCQEAFESVRKAEADLEIYKELVRLTDPKRGALATSILKYITDPLCRHCNDFLQEIHSDINMRFVIDNGMKIMCRPHGKDSFLPVSGLSEGEKALAMLALMDMVSDITGTKVLVFDSLEKMDGETLGKLMEEIGAFEICQRYDHILLATVEHKSVEEMIVSQAQNAMATEVEVIRM